MAASDHKEDQWGLGPITHRLHEQLGYNKTSSEAGFRHYLHDLNDELRDSLNIEEMLKNMNQVVSSLADQLHMDEKKLASYQELKDKHSGLTDKDKEEKLSFTLVKSLTFSQKDAQKLALLIDPEALKTEIKMIKDLLLIFQKQPDFKGHIPALKQQQFEEWDKEFRNYIENYSDLTDMIFDNKDFLLGIKIIVSTYALELENVQKQIKTLLNPASKIKLEVESQTEFLQKIKNTVDKSLEKIKQFKTSLDNKITKPNAGYGM